MRRAKRSRLEILKSDAQPADDKRVFCRFALADVPVRYKDLKVGEKGSGICKNISGGGANFECLRQIKTRTPLELWFDLPNGLEPMHLLGKVTWSRLLGATWRVGIVFDRPRLMSLTRILKETPGNA